METFQNLGCSREDAYLTWQVFIGHHTPGRAYSGPPDAG